MGTKITKNQEASIPTKNGGKYSYKYVDIAQIHDFLEENNMSYYQYIDRIDGDDYIMTVKIIDGKESQPLRGSRVVDATLYGNDNPAQKQGSALTYARRYSLLMAFGLATEDDDGQALNKIPEKKQQIQKTYRQMIIDYCRENKLNIEEIAKDYNLTNNTTEEQYKKVFEDLTGGNN